MAPALQGQRVRLRPLAPEHLAPLAELMQAPSVVEWWGHFDEERLREELLDYPSVGAFAVEFEGRLVGVVDYYEVAYPQNYHATLDIAMGSAYQGLGLGSDALRILIDYLVKERGHHRLTIDPSVENLAAVRCYEKLGFERVGIMHKCDRAPDGRWRDGVLLELVVDNEPVVDTGPDGPPRA
jgi:aminoglycoside 6'-N-acetyltransferase